MSHQFDPTVEPQADFALVRQQLEQGYHGPFLLLDSAVLREKARRFQAAMPRVRPHYAVKCNPDQRVLQILHEEGCGFEIASTAELNQVLALGVPGEQIRYSNPVKSIEAICAARDAGVKWYVVDCVEELRKIHALQPDASYYLRLYTSNEGSVWQLSGKFGVPPEDALPILQEAQRLGADLAGATFHAGSQCLNPDNWRIGIEACRELFEQMRSLGLRPRLLNIGGGFPVEHLDAIPSIQAIGEVVNPALQGLDEEIMVMAEPGRFMVSDAGYLVTKVIGNTVRRDVRWAYLDAGVFNGLLETTTGIEYDMRCDKQGERVAWTVAGPTCDSMDICTRKQLLPLDLCEGDFVYVRNAGAYSNACAGTFNGFALPEVYVV